MIRDYQNIKVIFLIIAFLFLTTSTFAQESSATNYQGKVLSVESGKSLVIEIDKRKLPVALIGIDVIEIDQPIGKQSGDNLSRLLKGKKVIFASKNQLNLTKEQIIRGKVLLDGQDVGLQQIRTGLAFTSKDSRSDLIETDGKSYEAAEQEAFEKRLGLWSNDYKCKDDLTTDKSSGIASVEILIDKFGNVVQAKALCGNPIFRSAAVKAALKSKFQPTILAGQPLKVKSTIKYKFAPELK